MGLLEKLKSALGLDGARSSETTRSGDVDVTVEREPSTDDEDAVKGTDTATTSTAEADTESADDTTTPDTEATEPAADEPDADAESSEADAEDAEAPETGEVDAEADAEDDADAEPSDAGEVDGEADAEDDADADPSEAGDATDEGSTDPVTELNGIGPAYAERLEGLDIETVGELANADAADIADQTDLGEKRVSDWIDQAQSY